MVCDDGKTCTDDSCDGEACTEPLCEDPTGECAPVCPCVFECIPEGCGLDVQTAALAVCPGGTGRLELDVTNTSGCTRLIRVALRDTSGGAILFASGMQTVDAFYYSPGETRHLSPTFTVSPDSPLAIGSLAVDVSAAGNGCTLAVCATAMVTVDVRWLVDLQLDGLSEEDELLPGGFVGVNEDDDNNNGTPDNAESGAVAGEDDLRELTVTADGTQAGTLTLSAQSGGDKIRLYAGADRTDPVGLPYSWPLLGLGKTLFVTLYLEGADVSSGARDVSLQLRLEGDPPPCIDEVRLTVVRARLKSVNFGGDDYIELRRDATAVLYSAPHWLDNSSPLDGDAEDVFLGDRKYPVAFARGSRMTVEPVFVVEPASAFVGPILVGGDGELGYDFNGSGTVGGGELNPGELEAAADLADEVAYFEFFSIAWLVSPNGGDTWIGAGENKSPLYVTLAAPPLPPALPRYHTLFRNSCRDAAGATTESAVLAGVWSDFTDRDVRRADDDYHLTYYDTWTCGNTTTAALLATGDGQCGAWAKLMLDMMRVHGITHALPYVVLYNRVVGDPTLGFMVKNWSIPASGGISGDAEYAYLGLNPVLGSSSITWSYSQATDLLGMAGQGTSNPASFFGNHQVVLIGGTYYDPSYGTSFESLSALEDASIAGFYKIIVAPDDAPFEFTEAFLEADLNGDGDFDDTFSISTKFHFQANPAGTQLVEDRKPYP